MRTPSKTITKSPKSREKDDECIIDDVDDKIDTITKTRNKETGFPKRPL